MKKLSREDIVFGSIILIAFLMRVWNYWNWSFTHDELGAFVRLNYNSFSDLITEGVRNNDTHPAFTQLFLFAWGKIFGLSEASIRLPFILAGTGSVALLYYISKKWFGFTTACLAALSLALLEFPILYSQLARPYSFGLFFSLLAVWYWTRFLLDSDGKLYKKAILYGVATALCMLTHYFAFFFAMIVAGTGFFFLKKENWKPYVLSGVIAGLIFLPHISVSLHQFSMGGIGQWLAKPGKDFLWKYILYGFNDSPVVVITVASVVLLSVVIYHADIKFSRLQTVCLVWFLFPFLAGYYYSIEVNPVLQYSTLLFSYPFLLVFLFSFFKEYKTTFNNMAYGVLAVVLLTSTVLERKFYKREDFGVFKEINAAVIDLQNQYGADKITTVLNTSSKDIFDFYFKQNDQQVNFDFYAGDDSSYVADMLEKVKNTKTPYFLYGWSNFRNPYEIAEIIRLKYPCIVYDEQHFNSQVTLFTQGDTSCQKWPVFVALTGFDDSRFEFNYDTTNIDTTDAFDSKYSLHVTPKTEYCITLRKKVKELFKGNTFINVELWVKPQGIFNAQLVMDVGQPTGKRDWQAKLTPKFIRNKDGWNRIFATFELPSTAFPDDEVKIHLWNPGKNSFYLDDVMVFAFADSKYEQYKVSYRK